MAGKDPNGEWSFKVERNVAIGDFPKDMDFQSGTAKAIAERWESVASQSSVTAHVAIMETEGNMSEETFKMVQKAAQTGLRHGVTKWAIVDDGIKHLAVKSKLPDEVDVLTTDDRAEAMEWAQA